MKIVIDEPIGGNDAEEEKKRGRDQTSSELKKEDDNQQFNFTFHKAASTQQVPHQKTTENNTDQKKPEVRPHKLAISQLKIPKTQTEPVSRMTLSPAG